MGGYTDFSIWMGARVNVGFTNNTPVGKRYAGFKKNSNMVMIGL